jgi:hypothetical protein
MTIFQERQALSLPKERREIKKGGGDKNFLDSIIDFMIACKEIIKGKKDGSFTESILWLLVLLLVLLRRGLPAAGG